MCGVVRHKECTILYAFLSLQAEKSETNIPIRNTKGFKISNQYKTKKNPKFGIIYINASSKNKKYFSNTVMGNTEMANGNN